MGRVDRVALLRQTLSLVEIAFGGRETGSRPHMTEDLIRGCSQESDALARSLTVQTVSSFCFMVLKKIFGFN